MKQWIKFWKVNMNLNKKEIISLLLDIQLQRWKINKPGSDTTSKTITGMSMFCHFWFPCRSACKKPYHCVRGTSLHILEQRKQFSLIKRWSFMSLWKKNGCLTKVNKSFVIFWYILQLARYLLWLVVGVLTHCPLLYFLCDLKPSQMNVQHNLIQQIMPYDFEMSHNAAEATKNICCTKDERAVDHSIITRWFKKFCLGCKNLNNQAMSGGPKTVDSEAVWQTIVSNLVSTGWNDKIVCWMKTGFLFLLQTIYKLASCVQIPRAIGAFYHVWKWHNVQRARSEMCHCTTMLSTDPSYDNRTIASTLKMQIRIAMNNRDVPRVMKTKFPATVMVFGVVSSDGHITSLKSAWKSTPKCTWICWRVWWSLGAIRWLVADPGCGSRTRCRPTSLKRPKLGFRRSATTLYPSLTAPPPSTWICWTTSFGHTSRTSPTWPPTTPKLTLSPPFAEYSPSSCLRLWKRRAPSSRSVSRWWLRLKAATLNRCQLYNIIKLPELIFSIKVLK